MNSNKTFLIIIRLSISLIFLFFNIQLSEINYILINNVNIFKIIICINVFLINKIIILEN